MDKKLQTLILYICSHIPQSSIGVLKINKLVWFIESEYYRKYQKQITKAKFAAIDHGPVIDGYSEFLDKMEKSGKLSIDKSKNRHVFRAMEDVNYDDVFTSDELLVITDVVNKLSNLNANSLERLSHQDAYHITLHENGGNKGRIIDMELTLLDNSPLDDSMNEFEEAPEDLIEEVEEVLNDED